jgi:rhamnosyl/mannosyltransferase
VLRYYKGLHILLDAVAGSELELVIAGSGPMDHPLRQEASRRGIKNIRFLGYVSDQEKVALIKSCMAMVLPSHLRSEAFGISLLEGAMYGKPLISTEIGTGTSYVNEHLKTGIVVPSGDARMLREAMEYLTRHPQAVEEMGIAAHERYQRLFTGKQMGEAYCSLYREVSEIGGERHG